VGQALKIKPIELGLACLVLLGVIFFSTADWSWAHPGFNHYDEEAAIARVQLGREGMALPLVAFRGCLGTLAMAAGAACLGPRLSSLHAVVLLGFVLECLLLGLLASRIFSGRAGVWAVVVNGVCAFTLLRARVLLSYAFLPMEWLLLLLLLPHALRRTTALLWGLAASALLLDYEAWALGLPVLGAAFWMQHRAKGLAPWALGGLALGSALILALSWDMLAGHVALRLAMNVSNEPAELGASAWKALKSFWSGGDYLSFVAAKGQPAFPAWALPLLVAGLVPAWRRWKSGLAWIAVGFLPLLLASGSAAEPQRALLAWAPLCLIAGAGAESLIAWRPRLAPFALGALCLYGAAAEGRAYLKSIHAQYVTTYGESANLIAAVRELKRSEAGPRRFITELNYKSGAPIRFLLSDLKQAPDSGQVVAFVPWEYGPGMKGDWGRRDRIASQVSQGYSPPVLLYPLASKIRRLDAIEAELRPLWSKAYLDGNVAVRSAALAYLDAHPQADAWVRTACWESFLDSSMIMRQVPRQRVAQAMKEVLLSATFYEWMARVSLYEDKDPLMPLAYASAALKLDPSRENSRDLFRQAQQRAKQAP
jgi:hypothetical protein